MLVPPEPLCGGVYDCSILPRPAAFVNGQSVNFIWHIFSPASINPLINYRNAGVVRV